MKQLPVINTMNSWLSLLIIAGTMLMTVMAAFAQQSQPPQVDPRLSGAMINVLQAEIQLRNAMGKAMQEDAEALRQSELNAWAAQVQGYLDEIKTLRPDQPMSEEK